MQEKMNNEQVKKTFKPVPDVECLKYHGTPEKPDIKIFVSHRIDKDSETIDNPLYIPVRCGAVYDDRENVDMLGDDTGDNISEKRHNFCELTVVYWAWKNIEADYLGLCHYRRYFNFGEEQETDCYSNVFCDYLSNANKKKFALEDTNKIIETVKQYDVIITTPYNVTKAPEKYEDLFEQYDATPTMHRRDLDTALDLLKEIYPNYHDDAMKFLHGNLLYPCNMFIMKKKIFNEYCEWIFPFLFELEKRIDLTFYCQEEVRGLGHVAERLLGVFLAHKVKQNPNLSIGELQRVFFNKTTQIQSVFPSRSELNIPVVFASSDYYTPYLAITIYSMLYNANKKYHYDLIILTTDIGEQMEKNLRNMIDTFDNCTLRIVDVNPYMQNKHFIVNGSHVSKETFYRLFTPELFCNFNKIVYLDSDLIVLGDISELYELPMQGNLIAATKDCDFAGEYNGGLEMVKPYCDKNLKLKNPYSYFQAGVIVVNITNMRKEFKEWELVDYAQTKSFLYVDQDVLNVKCEGKVIYLEPKWNVLSDCNQIRINKFILRAPENMYLDYMEARKNPAIIHYAGFEKPWNSPLSDFSAIFWYYARQTLFYEAILLRMIDETIVARQPVIKSSNLRIIADRIFPKGTKRRKFAKKIYYFFRPNKRPK